MSSRLIEMRYCADYAVEPFDHVLFDFRGLRHDGQIVKLHPMSGEATVRFEMADHLRRRGQRRQTSIRLPVSEIEFERRDG